MLPWPAIYWHVSIGPKREWGRVKFGNLAVNRRKFRVAIPIQFKMVSDDLLFFSYGGRFVGTSCIYACNPVPITRSQP